MSRKVAPITPPSVEFRTLVEQSSEAMLLHAKGVVIYANPATAAMIGISDPSALVGRSLVDLAHPEARSLIRSINRDAGDGRNGQRLSYRIMHADGLPRHVEVTSVRTSHAGRPAVLSHVRDVTSQRALEAQLEHQAFHDPLTGLANRALFRDRVSHAVTRAARRKVSPAVVFIDLDNFKHINDTIGHAGGDELLTTVARRLQAVIRPSDTVARLGGDEFAVLIEDTGSSLDAAQSASHVAERIVQALEPPCLVAGRELLVTVSVGIAVARPQENGEDVLRNADMAMYRAKSRGKGRYELFEEELHDALRRRRELEEELRVAVEECADLTSDSPDCQFEVYYQPIVSLTTGDISSVEALFRWRHPHRGMVPLRELVPLAEETGLIVPIGRWVLREACRQASQWQRKGIGGRKTPALGVTVNLSARELIETDLRSDVGNALTKSGLAPHHLTLEMTEGILVDDARLMVDKLRALKEIGVMLAIDDFGTGYSSLGYLERFPIDVLKIDRTFIETMGRGPLESPLPRAILGLGGVLGMRVAAEGIETEGQMSRLRELGCELGQGFYVAHPKPAEEVGE